MFFSGALRSKLLSLLRPWLEQEPEVELKLGFLSSRFVAKNLTLDPSAISSLIKNSTDLEFKRVTIRELSIRISPWSFPSLIAEVRGVDVTLAPRESIGARRTFKRDSAAKRRKEVIASLDPEGASLHDIIERISLMAASENGLKTVLKNVMLRSCRIQVEDIHLKLQFINDSHACLLKMDELSLEPQLLHGISLFRGLFGSLFHSRKVSFLDIRCTRAGLGLKENDNINWIASMMALSACVRLNKLLIDYSIRIPHMDFHLSPTVIPVLLVILDVLSSKRIEGERTGQELWKIAAKRLGYLSLTPMLSLYRVLGMVSLWLRYVYAYESLLLMVGYSADKTSRNNIANVSSDYNLLARVKRQWELVSELEEKLPPEALASARRIARHKTLSFSCSGNSEVTAGSMYTSLLKIPALLLYLWRVVCFIFQSLIHFSIIPMLRGASNDPASHPRFGLSLEELCITLSQADDGHASINGKIDSAENPPSLKFASFCLVASYLCIIYTVDGTTNSFLLAFGELKMHYPSLSKVSTLKVDSRDRRNLSSKGLKHEQTGESKIILWGDPALQYNPSENDAFNSLDPVLDRALIFTLESTIGDLWSNWKKASKNYEEMNFKHKREPFILFEVKNYLMDPCIRHEDYGLWKCTLALGKLNFDLDYSSILSITLLVTQLNLYYQWTTRVGRPDTLANSPSIMLERFQTKSTNNVDMYTTRMKAAILNIFPDKNIQIGALITGPSIRILLENELLGDRELDFSSNIAQGKNGYCLSVDLATIELGVWPAYKADLTQILSQSGFNEGTLEYLSTMEPKKVDIPKPHANESFYSEGRIPLDACMRFNALTVMVDASEVNQHSQIVKPISLMLQLSTCRYYLHSLTATVNNLSMAMSGISTGATVLLCMDELWILFQMFEGMFSVALSTCNNFDSVSAGYSQDFVRKLITSAREIAERNIVESEHTNETMIITSTQIFLDATLQFEPMDAIFNDSRGNCSRGTPMKSNGASGSGTPYFSVSPEHTKSSIHELLDLPSFGIGVFIRKSCVNISWQGTNLDLLSDFSGFESVIFSHQNLSGVCTDISQIKSMLKESSEQLYLFILSNCKFSLHFDPHGITLPSASVSNAENVFDSTELRYSSANANDSNPQSRPPDHTSKTGYFLTRTTSVDASGCCVLVDMQLGEISMSSYGIKDELTGKHQPDNLEILVLICKEVHAVNCEIQGGYVFLETLSLAAFVHCFQAYYQLLTNSALSVLHISRGSSQLVGFSRVSEESVAKPTNMSGEELVMGGALVTAPLPESENVFKWNFLKDFTLHQSRFCLTLAGKDVSGHVQELVVEADTSVRLIYFERKFLFDLKRLSIFTRSLHACMLDRSVDLLMPDLGSNRSVTSSTRKRSRNYNFSSQVTENLSSRDEKPLQPPAFPKEKLVLNSASSSSFHGNYILEHLVASVMIEKVILGSELGYVQLKSDWVGNGFISGMDLAMTLSEIQILSELFAPLSGISNGKTSDNLNQRVGSRAQELMNEEDFSIQEGAIVVIKDLHQHTYFAVEGVNSKYHVGGTLHYTLVGERALFRVKYHKGWISKVPSISLISLYAKNGQGEPLRLNYSPGSGFVEISSSKDKGGSLWQTFPYKHNSYEDDDHDAKSYNTSARKAFHLVNRKCDCAVAFVDGSPEFVKKPGNPFKAKVLNDFVLTRNGSLSVPSGHSNVTLPTNSQEESSQVEVVSLFGSSPPYINITIDKIVLTIFHEVSDANDKVPLIRGSITDINIMGQMLVSKFRIISSFSAAIQYMELRRNVWRDIVSPFGSSLFFHSRFPDQDFTEVNKEMPAHVYFSMRQVDLSLSEISLDVLLYVVGYLNFAGPYAVRRSVIFPNCGKLENCSGLSLLCHFPDNQDVTVTGKQSASIFLRHVSIEDQPTRSESLVSVCLTEHGLYSTTPIDVSISNDCLFAWRTRAISLKDSRSFPGPFVVIEVRQRTEDGLSLVVSPLLRICNESGFSMELRFHRPQETEQESATILLKSGDTIDDSIALFRSLELSGGPKRALMSLTLGNFLLSVRPEIANNTLSNVESVSVKWSEEVQGGKALRVSGIFDKLSYRFRRAFALESVKSFFSSLHCPLIIDGQHVSDIYFLVQTTGRDVPVMQPQNVGDTSESKTSPVALQLQKEIFIYPTVQVYNLLQSEIHVLLTENHPDLCISGEFNDFGKNATIPCGSSAYLYANPAMIYFTVTLTTYSSKCKPVSSVEWLKKLHKQKSEVQYIDTELDFGGGKYFAFLRLSRAEKGILEVTVFTSYTLQNDTELSLLCSASNRKPLTQGEFENYGSKLPPDIGCFLPPKSTGSWFLKSNKVHLKWLAGNTSSALLDLDMLSGFTELCLEAQDDVGLKRLTKLGVSLQPCNYKVSIRSQVICIRPRYIIANESKESIMVRQCYLQDDTGGITTVEGNQKVALEIRKSSKKRETSILDSVIRRHRNVNEDSQVFIQFCLREIGFGWSGPICVSSLGRFFLKFKRSSDNLDGQSNASSCQGKKSTQCALLQIVEENSSLVLHFYKPVDVPLPYRIENFLHGSSIMYCQKGTMESDTLISGDSIEYIWDDLNLPHKLVIQITDLQLSREINIDKMCTWKSFFKMRQHKGLVLHLASEKGSRVEKKTDESHGLEVFKVGYEVYADGLTRVLRICERADSYEEEKMIQPSLNFQFRVSHFAIHLLETNKEDFESKELPIYSTIVVGRLTNISLDSLITDQYKYHSIRVQSINVDEKWQGAHFASMLRRNQIHEAGPNENILHITFILQSTSSSVKQVKYSSIILQPIDLKVDEETLMKLVPFWRTSLSDSRTQSRQFYFKHFEIHPIKIFASFLPGNPNSTYSSSQETLRSLLHSIIKVPAVNNMVVELNGILLTHALVTFRELVIKCAQHYSWYVMRAIYIAKGSPLLPPAFASIFDDTASSSLDVFFDPSDGSVNLPGLTLGMFKFISKCIDSKGFSGTKRYFGDLGKTIKLAGSNAIFAAVTEISDSIVRGAETSGLNGMVTGFHQGILRLAMEPSFLGAAVLEGGPDRKIKLDHSPGVDELYIEGYLQAMLDVVYKQEYLRVRVIDNQVILKNLPPNSSVINEIMENVKSFLVSKALLKGDPSTASRPLRHLRTESEWKIGPTVLTLCEHLFVSFAIRMLRKQANKIPFGTIWQGKADRKNSGEPSPGGSQQEPSRKWAVGRFVFSGMVAYLDGRLCRHIPNPIARRIVSGFLLSYLDDKNDK